MSTIGPAKVHRAELQHVRHGTSWARVETVNAVLPLGPALLTLGDLALAGTIIDGGEDTPASWAGIWVTGAAWDKPLPYRAPYQNDDGVRLKTVLADLATDLGTPIALPADIPMGTHWQRATRGGDRKPRTGRDELLTLQRLGYVPAWWLDPLGVARFTVRTGAPVKATARVMSRSLAFGQRVIGAESVAAFTPGGTFEGATIERVIVREDGGKLVIETWAA